jgi:purine-nucleoside phosphorylase
MQIIAIGESQLGDRIGEPVSGLLAPPGQVLACRARPPADLIASLLASTRQLASGLLATTSPLPTGLLAPSSHLVEQIKSALPGLGGGAGRRGKRSLDGRAQRILSPVAAGRLAGPLRFRVGDHCWSLAWKGDHLSWRRPMPPYVRSMGPTAAAAILCGDPARALAIAQELLSEPRMSNHHRGLWGYFGETADGRELTIQATGIGGPSAAIVVSELARRGMRAAIRVGTCRSAGPAPEVGTSVTATRVVGHDGTSAALSGGRQAALRPDQALATMLAQRTDVAAELHSFDRLYPPTELLPADAVHDLQSAAFLAAAAECRVPAAVALVISRNSERPLEDEPLAVASVALAREAAEALADLGEPTSSSA